MEGESSGLVRVPDDIIIVEDDRLSALVATETFGGLYPQSIEDAVCENLLHFQDRFDRFLESRRQSLFLILDGNFPLRYGDDWVPGAYTHVLERIGQAVRQSLGALRVIVLPFSGDEQNKISTHPVITAHPESIRMLSGGKPLHPKMALSGLQRIHEEDPDFYS